MRVPVSRPHRFSAPWARPVHRLDRRAHRLAEHPHTARQPAQPIRVRRHGTTLKARAVLAKQIKVQPLTTQIQAMCNMVIGASMVSSVGDNPEIATEEAPFLA